MTNVIQETNVPQTRNFGQHKDSPTVHRAIFGRHFGPLGVGMLDYGTVRPIDDFINSIHIGKLSCQIPNIDEIFELLLTRAIYPTDLENVAIVGNEAVDQVSYISPETLEVINEITGFKKYQDGWDGPDSKRPSSEAIENAVIFVNSWDEKLETLSPELELDGVVTLEMYDQKGLTKGGVSFAENDKASYSIVNRTEKIASGYFNPKSETEINRSILEIENALKKFEL